MTDRILSSRYEQSLDLYFQVYGFSFSEKRNKYLAYKNGSVTTFNEGNDLSFIILYYYADIIYFIYSNT